MINLIKMDLYRLVHSVSFWIMIAVTVALAVFSTGMTKYDLDLVAEEGESSLRPEEDTQMFGVVVETNYEWLDGEIGFDELVSVDLASSLVLILPVIFIPLFVNGEQKNGFVKNIAGQLPNRGMLAVSKLFAAAVQVFVIFVIYCLSVAAAGRFYFGERFVIGSVTDFLFIFVLHYLLHVSFGAVVLMLTVVLKNSAFSMVFGILCCCGISMLAYNLINIAVHFISKVSEFDISKYMIETNIECVRSGLGQSDLFRIILVGFGFLAASAMASAAVMQKRDIR